MSAASRLRERARIARIETLRAPQRRFVQPVPRLADDVPVRVTVPHSAAGLAMLMLAALEK